MFRLTNSFRTLNVTSEVLKANPNVINSQIIRWRKPRWLPVAKSKMFKVPPRTIIPEDEKIELKRLTNNYNTQIKSIRRYLFNKYYVFGLSQADPEEEKRKIEEDFARCAELNEKWNEEQKVLREKRVAEELEADLDFARKRVERELEKQDQRMQLIEEIVRKEKEYSKYFITSENIDTAIEAALASPVDYNFAIDLTGKKTTAFDKENKEEKHTASISQ